MDWLTFLGIAMLASAAHIVVRFSYYGSLVVDREQSVTLRNGDKIKCHVSIRIDGSLGYCLSLVIPRLANQEAAMRNEANALASGIISRWALQFERAADTQYHAAYDSLERALNDGIRSSNFDAVEAQVTGIEVIYAEKSDITKDEPEELSPVDAVRKKHCVVVEEIEAIQQSEAEITAKHASVTADPDVQEELKTMFGADKREAIFRDAPLGYRRNIDRKKRRG